MIDESIYSQKYCFPLLSNMRKRAAESVNPQPRELRSGASVGQTKKGRVQGTKNFSGEDLADLVSHVKHIKPIGQAQWELVSDLYNAAAVRRSRTARTTHALREKWNRTVRKKPSTGDSFCPQVCTSNQFKKDVCSNQNSS